MHVSGPYNRHTDPGAGAQGGNEGEDQPPNGDAISAPPADGYPASQPDRHRGRATRGLLVGERAIKLSVNARNAFY